MYCQVALGGAVGQSVGYGGRMCHDDGPHEAVLDELEAHALTQVYKLEAVGRQCRKDMATKTAGLRQRGAKEVHGLVASEGH